LTFLKEATVLILAATIVPSVEIGCAWVCEDNVYSTSRQTCRFWFPRTSSYADYHSL